MNCRRLTMWRLDLLGCEYILSIIVALSCQEPLFRYCAMASAILPAPIAAIITLWRIFFICFNVDSKDVSRLDALLITA
uniref:Uncharacterized protein n=1 Tax=Anopheles darlingi TaxID=43151 RepID=A0A2M4DRJ7_ANODA